MRKCDELTDPESCLNKAEDDELLFVLLERDPAAPAAITKWAQERIRLGLNKPGDPKLLSAAKWIEDAQQRKTTQEDK